MNRLRNNSHRSSGFTLVELTMGMLVLMIIIATLGGLAMAMGQGWKSSESQDNLQIARRQTSTQMYYNVRSAKFLGYAASDDPNSGGSGSGKKGATVLFWKGDKDPGKTMYAYQVAMLEHDMEKSTLRLYTLPQTAPGAMIEFKQGDIDEDCDVDSFRKLTGLTSQVIGRNVKDVTFKMLPASSTRQSQALEFTIRYKSDEQEQFEYGTATLRGPQAPKQ